MEKKAEMKEKQIVSESLKDTLREGKRITAGFILKNGCSRLGKTVSWLPFLLAPPKLFSLISNNHF